jgi:hypothetical protein
MSRLRESARGQECLVRLPGVCNFNPETVVLAHLGGAGMALKKHDLHGAFCCSSCHDEVDRRTWVFEKDYTELAHRQGVERTQNYWIENGMVTTR